MVVAHCFAQSVLKFFSPLILKRQKRKNKLSQIISFFQMRVARKDERLNAECLIL